MKVLTAVVTFLLVASPAVAQSEVGVSLAGLSGTPAQRVRLAKELGASWYRPEPVLLGSSAPVCNDCEVAHGAGLKIALVVRNSAAVDKASSAVANISAFEQGLRAVLERVKPQLLIVETEPDDFRSFSGTSEEYGAELKMACDIGHASKIGCADGGISSATVTALVTDERWKSDQLDAAKFAIGVEAVRLGAREPLSVFGKTLKRSPEGEPLPMLNATDKYLKRNSLVIERARAIISVSESAGADYLNFHWYELQPENIAKVADTLHLLSKRKIMTDELGQRNERPFETGEKLRQALASFVRPIIWSAVDGRVGSIGLVDQKGKLRSNAAGFQRVARQLTNPQ